MQDVIAQVHDERLAAGELPAKRDGVRNTERGILRDVRDARAECGTVAHGFADLLVGFSDYDGDFLDAGGNEMADREVKHGDVSDRHELLGARVRERAQTATLSSGQHDALHRVAV